MHAINTGLSALAVLAVATAQPVEIVKRFDSGTCGFHGVFTRPSHDDVNLHHTPFTFAAQTITDNSGNNIGGSDDGLNVSDGTADVDSELPYTIQVSTTNADNEHANSAISLQFAYGDTFWTWFDIDSSETAYCTVGAPSGTFLPFSWQMDCHFPC